MRKKKYFMTNPKHKQLTRKKRYGNAILVKKLHTYLEKNTRMFHTKTVRKNTTIVAGCAKSELQKLQVSGSVD